MKPPSWSSAALLGFGLPGVVLAGVGCDLPPSRGLRGPVVVGVEPEPGVGDIDRQTTFRIELDRRVAAGSVAQGVVALTSGDNYAWVDMQLGVVRPILLVTPLSPLDPEVDYQLVVHPLRDLDGHSSADTDPLVFHTGRAVTPPVETSVGFEAVAPIFAACATAGCHVGPDAVLGLDLSSAEAIGATALGIPAHEVRPGVDGYVQIDVSASMVGLPRIQAGNPARSYLLYTMLGDPHIAGDPMPPTGELASEAELLLVERWIQSGTPGL